MGENLDIRNYDELSRAIALSQHTVYKRYLSELEQYPLVTPTQILLDEDTKNSVRFIQLEQLSGKKGEDIFQKLTTVYHASMSLGCNLIVMVDVEKINSPTKIYVGVRNDGRDDISKTRLSTSYRTLKNGIRSNFPGTKFKDVPSADEMTTLVNDIFGDTTKHITSVSCVASARDKSKTENKSFVQGIERFIDAMQGNTYTAIFIAEPISNYEQSEMRRGYENLYTALYSFNKSVWTYNESASESVMESLSSGISKAISEGTSKTQSHTKNVGINIGLNSARTNSNTISHTDSFGKTSPTAVARAGQALAGSAGLFKLIGKIAAPINPVLGGTLLAANGVLSTVGSVMQGGSTTSTSSDTLARTIGGSLGLSGGLNAGYSKTTSDTVTHTETDTNTETKTSGNTSTQENGRNLQIENINKSIDEMLKHIDNQLKRTQECEDYGAYSCGAYFLSGKQDSCMLAANTFRALMLGDGSSVESGAINAWNGIEEPEKVKGIKEYLRRFVHPIFAMPISTKVNDIDDFVTYTPGTIVSGLELPLHLGLPTKSVFGLPVIEHADFGRNVIAEADKEENSRIVVGNIYHMGDDEKNAKVELDVLSLASHTFITGSTGAGKSTAIYSILDKLMKCNVKDKEEQIKFLVIEPAKGEYKNRFGAYDNVSVYGTNNKKTPLLRINPFSFPEDVHVLEHIERLIEIFNVCWPMYAAMPAVLKDAIEKAYISAGWNLDTSENIYESEMGKSLFPSFIDVLNQVNHVMEESAYSSDSKGDYKGALCTRLNSLTNGLYGQIFSNEELTCEELFDRNVIVDLSRTGSSETKALIMGLLIMKLQEYRMSNSEGNNEALKHVTVLEEAHNLLKRTSLEQSSESSNVLGKSVEMLSNSIAEMRTYGEGFIIADQSPGLLDLSAIRNTNTKIILRLPDLEDRELVGKAACLNDEQIVELSRLETFVAAIYQNNWLEPVLCRMETNFKDSQNYTYNGESVDKIDKNKLIEFLLMPFDERTKMDQGSIDELVENIYKLQIPVEAKVSFLRFVRVEHQEEIQELREQIIYHLFNCENAFMLARRKEENIGYWYEYMREILEPKITQFDQTDQQKIVALLTKEKAQCDKNEESKRLFERFIDFI